MNVDVLGDIEWFRRERGADAPVILTLYHGTTHAFEAFDASRVNMENMFGRQLYFTSSERDAELNYASIDGPDLKNRLTAAAERMEDEHEDYADAEAAARAMLYGGQEAVLTVEVTLRKPLILGLNAWHGMVDEDDLHARAAAKVAEDEGLDVQEMLDAGDHEDLIWEAQEELAGEAFEAFEALLDRALENTGMTIASDGAASTLYELFREAHTAEEIFKAIETAEHLLYLFEDDSGLHNVKPVVAELFHLSGHDAIIVLDAKARCWNMDMDDGTSHVALSLDHLSQIRILDRREIRLDAENDFSM